MAHTARYAVLTGDIVASSRTSPEGRRHLPELIRAAGEDLPRRYREAVHGEIDVFRGDSWQMVLGQPREALRIAVFLRARLRSEPGFRRLDSRISIGFGSIAYLPDQNVSTGNGQAFQLSGEGLEALPNHAWMSLSFPRQQRSVITQGLNVVVQLIDLQVQRWTGKQAEAVSGALIDLTQREIATAWFREQVTQQTISQHLDGAGWVQVKDGLSYFEDVLPRVYEAGVETGG